MPTDNTLFSHIALSLSGGGIRAVGFHLGTLDCLERVGLLANVHILSTVSGGSLVGTSYALSQQLGRDFQDCFDNLYAFLPELNTLEEIFSRLTGDEVPFPSGRRDLITAMANVFHDAYYARYYEAAEFGVFWEPGNSHLKEIMFNATEFKTGTAFRFQKSEFACRIGNGHVSIREQHARRMRMADVMAASCCIPTGMEPLFFPYDFHWPDDDQAGRPTCSAVARDLQEQTGDNSLAIMDGGVYDNQGLSSVLLAMLRRDHARDGEDGLVAGEPVNAQGWGQWMKRVLKAGASTRDTSNSSNTGEGPDLAPLDLFIISDTPLRPATLYPDSPPPEPEQEPGFFGRRTLGQYDMFAWLVTLLLFLSAMENLYTLVDHQRAPAELPLVGLFHDIIGFAIPAFICGITVAALIWSRLALRRAGQKIRRALPRFNRTPWHYLRQLRLADVTRMVNLRVGSTAALTAKIYLNRIRQLGYSTVFAADNGPNPLSARIMTNEIFTLLDNNILDARLPAPTADMLAIADRAATMKTAVWVDPEVSFNGRPELDILISAGQTATCYNLMLHLNQRFADQATGGIPAGHPAATLLRELKNLWGKLEQDPFALLDERKAGITARPATPMKLAS
jgi:hypothetical protein